MQLTSNCTPLSLFMKKCKTVFPQQQQREAFVSAREHFYDWLDRRFSNFVTARDL